MNENESAFRSLQHILGKLVQDRFELHKSPELINYRHLLDRSYQNLPYILSQVEEELIAEKDNNGISALSQLRESWVASQVLDVEIGGKKQALSMNQASSLLSSENRETRRIVSEAYYESFARDKLLHGTALRAICADHVNMTRRRKRPSFMTQSLIDQDVDEQTITTLLKTLEDEASSFQKYLHLKAVHLGYDRLLSYDVVAPWFSQSFWKSDWTNMKSSIIEAYDAFDDEIGNHVRSLFTDRRIDSEDKRGRRGGGFHWGCYEQKTSFIFITYNGTLSNAYTLAHELGHSVHHYFMNRHQSYLNTDASSCVSETGSIFGELLFTEQLLKECDNDELRIAILANVLNRFYRMSFSLGTFALFENSIYDAIGSGKILDADRACEIMRTTRQRIFGDAVEWAKNSDYAWAMMGNLYRPNFRFYNYSYSFAQLLVFALFKDYKQNPSDFKERFKRLLSRGGSMSPRDQIAELGYDITKPDFWKLGIKQAESFLDDLKKLI